MLTIFGLGVDLIEGNPLLYQPLDTLFGVAGGKFDRLFITQARPRVEGIVHMRFDTVLFVRNSSDASLGVIGGPLTQGSLAQYHHLGVVGETQR